MKRSAALVLASILLIASGCTGDRVRQGDDVPYPPPAEIECDGEPIRYDDISERFTIIVCPTRIINDRDGKSLAYDFGILNRSAEAYDDVTVSFGPSPELDRYLVAGAAKVAVILDVDVAPKGEAPQPDEGRGIDVRLTRFLIDHDAAKQADLDMGDVISLGERFEIELVWKGGEERHQLSSPVVDATSS